MRADRTEWPSSVRVIARVSQLRRVRHGRLEIVGQLLRVGHRIDGLHPAAQLEATKHEFERRCGLAIGDHGGEHLVEHPVVVAEVTAFGGVHRERQRQLGGTLGVVGQQRQTGRPKVTPAATDRRIPRRGVATGSGTGEQSVDRREGEASERGHLYEPASRPRPATPRVARRSARGTGGEDGTAWMVPPSFSSTTCRSTRDVRTSSARDGTGATSAISASVNQSAKPARRSTSARSSSGMLVAVAVRISRIAVRCSSAGSSRTEINRSFSSASSSSPTDCTLVLRAASSIASGHPSSRRQMRVMSAALHGPSADRVALRRSGVLEQLPGGVIGERPDGDHMLAAHPKRVSARHQHAHVR